MTRNSWRHLAKSSNIVAVYLAASDQQRRDGELWYPRAHQECRSIAESLSITIETACGIVAALSPQMSWEQNLRMARMYPHHSRPRHVRNAEDKARRIWHGEDPDVVLTGPKTNAFYHCLLSSGETDRVTVDRHALNVALGVRDRSIPVHNAIRARSSYDRIADLYRTAAAVLDVDQVCDVQATTWLTVKGLYT